MSGRQPKPPRPDTSGRPDRSGRPTTRTDLRFGYLIHDVSRLRRTLFDRWLSPSGITRSQWWVMAFLSRQDGMPQTQLADQLDVGKVALGALIDRLEASGFVQRIASAADRRVKLVHLTDQGRAMLREVRTSSREFNRRILAGISPSEVSNAIGTLAVIKQNLLEDGGGQRRPTASGPDEHEGLEGDEGED